jgi:hypothetical protein
MEAFHYKCEVFIKIKKLFEDIFREIEAFSKTRELFEDIFNETEPFSKKIISRDMEA